MARLVKKMLVASLLVCGTSGAGSADILTAAARTIPVTGTNTTFAPVPLNDSNATTRPFQTT